MDIALAQLSIGRVDNFDLTVTALDQDLGDEPAVTGVRCAEFPRISVALPAQAAQRLGHVTEPLWKLSSRPAAITGKPAMPAPRPTPPKRCGAASACARGNRHGWRTAHEQAQAELVELGVPAVGYDRLRQVGRGVRDEAANTAQLCGDGVAAISPDGAAAILAAITHNLLRAAGSLTSRFHARARGATLRRDLITVPARLAHPRGIPSCTYPPTGPGTTPVHGLHITVTGLPRAA